MFSKEQGTRWPKANGCTWQMQIWGVTLLMFLPRTPAEEMGRPDAVFQEAPEGVDHLFAILSAKKAYCRALACPEVLRYRPSSFSFWLPTSYGYWTAAWTARTQASWDSHPVYRFRTFRKASLKMACMFGRLGTGMLQILRDSGDWSKRNKKQNLELLPISKDCAHIIRNTI